MTLDSKMLKRHYASLQKNFIFVILKSLGLLDKLCKAYNIPFETLSSPQYNAIKEFLIIYNLFYENKLVN